MLSSIPRQQASPKTPPHGSSGGVTIMKPLEDYLKEALQSVDVATTKSYTLGTFSILMSFSQLVDLQAKRSMHLQFSFASLD